MHSSTRLAVVAASMAAALSLPAMAQQFGQQPPKRPPAQGQQFAQPPRGGAPGQQFRGGPAQAPQFRGPAQFGQPGQFRGAGEPPQFRGQGQPGQQGEFRGRPDEFRGPRQPGEFRGPGQSARFRGPGQFGQPQQFRNAGPPGQFNGAGPAQGVRVIGQPGYSFRGGFQGRRNVATFDERERAAWYGGRWRHERHAGRLGYWWEVNGAWYYYDRPWGGPPGYVSAFEFLDDPYFDPDAPPVMVGAPDAPGFVGGPDAPAIMGDPDAPVIYGAPEPLVVPPPLYAPAPLYVPEPPPPELCIGPLCLR